MVVEAVEAERCNSLALLLRRPDDEDFLDGNIDDDDDCLALD